MRFQFSLILIGANTFTHQVSIYANKGCESQLLSLILFVVDYGVTLHLLVRNRMQQTNLIVEATLNTGEQPRILLANHQLVFFLDRFVLLLLEFDLFLDTWVDYLVKLCEELLI